ncbi:hypothetical protein SAFG77S_12278 [Streptomyces afghaniensis]
MYAQNFLLSLAARGLAGIPQTILGVYADTVREFLGVPAELKLLFGISFGMADPTAPVNTLRTERVPLQRSVVVHDTPGVLTGSSSSARRNHPRRRARARHSAGPGPAPAPETFSVFHRLVQIVQGLWDSWEKDAWLLDVAGKRFADMDKIQPVNLQGKHAASAARGPSPRPSRASRSSSRRAAAVTPGTRGPLRRRRLRQSVHHRGRPAQRQALRDAAERAGRDPDEVVDLCQRVRYLGAMIGLPLGPGRLDEPLTADQLADAMPSPHDPCSAGALAVAREDWTMRDVLAHGVIDFHPVTVVSAADVADHMQQWFEAEACDGFSIAATATMTASTPSSTRSSRSCRNAAWSTTTTKAPHCARTSAPTSSTASTRASRSRPPS